MCYTTHLSNIDEVSKVMPLCDNCGSLEHWTKRCPNKVRRQFLEKQAAKVELESKAKVELSGCKSCEFLQAEVDRLRRKYEMGAEERLETIRKQNREAQKRYRNKRRAK